MEFALFATSVTPAVRTQVDEILSTIKPEFSRATSDETFMIALALQYLKINFEWKCIDPPTAPNRALVCTKYELLLA